jgi:hypothetical protein
MTYTFAILEVSETAFAEIMEKLKDAGYSQQLQKDGENIVIDMHGLALQSDGRHRCDIAEHQKSRIRG